MVKKGGVFISLYQIAKSHYPGRIAFPQNGAIALQYFDYTVQEIFDSAHIQEEIATFMNKKFHFGFTSTFDYGTIFVEALGIKLLKPDYDFHSTLENPIKTMDDLKALKTLDPRSDGNLPVYLEAVKRVKRISKKPQFCAIVGPFTLAAELCGVLDFARMTVRDQAFVKALLRFCKETVLAYALELQKSGVDVLQISEPTTVILSPKAFTELVEPLLKEISNTLSCSTVLHICGNTEKILDSMLQCGFDGISVDQIMDLGQVIQRVPENVVLVGNIDPLLILKDMGADDVRLETRKMLMSMEAHINYMPSFGCDLARDMPLENLDAFLEEVNNYRR